MNETQLTKKIRDALLKRGWDSIKFHGNMYSQNGIPDLIVHRGGQVIFMEIKLPGKKPTTLQKVTIDKIRRYGTPAEVIHSVEEAIAVLETLQVQSLSAMSSTNRDECE